MRIFLSVASLHPSYGGPARSVPGLADALSESGLKVGLWAADGTAPDTSFLRPDSRVERLGGRLTEALCAFDSIDVFHDNGIWLPHNHAIAGHALRRGCPRVISMRGMMDPWCWNNKRWKKSIAWPLYQRKDLKAATSLHATADLEADNIRKIERETPIAVISNGMDLPALKGGLPVGQSDGSDGKRVALFVGRIYPVKGLPMLIETWKRLRPKEWILHLVGPDFEGHQAEVERLIEREGLGEEIRLLGPLEGEKKQAAYEAAELFVLPTHSENFGMAVAEALAHGLPVVTTKAAPWPMLEKEQCGWWVDANSEALEGALKTATHTPREKLREMGTKGRQLIEEGFRWGAVADRMTELYSWMLRRGPEPTFLV